MHTSDDKLLQDMNLRALYNSLSVSSEFDTVQATHVNYPIMLLQKLQAQH